ncbi:MAG: hypothetical protein LBH26_01445 [Treponema sp.]|jgi:hypothetical protein|nr:hypothetical protein [Treponema sp.]
MKKILPALMLFAGLALFAEDPAGPLPESFPAQTGEEEAYQDYGMAEGVTIYGNAGMEAAEAAVLARLNGLSGERERFIEEDLLRDAGFQRSANARFRRTSGLEKSAAFFQGMAHAFFPGIALRPFSEIEYGSLPPGEFYRFDAVIYAGSFKNISWELRRALELEYMLQVEFCGGVLIRDWNLNYYTEENIAKFERLALSLPDSDSPAGIRRLKDRYLNEELPRIRAALDRYEYPSESALWARQNIGASFLEWLKTAEQ